MKQLSTCLILLFFGFYSSITNAQDYVITAKGDTLRGKVKMFVNGLDKRVQVTQNDKKKQTFTIIQIRGFYLQGENYRPVKFADSYVFMKLLKQGYLSLYAFQMKGQLTYDGRYLLKMDNQGMEVPNLGFKKAMARFLSECPELTTQIEDGNRGYKELDKIIDEFNTCINTKTNAQTETPAKSEALASVNLDDWNTLERKVQSSSLPEKSDALDMIKDVKNKLSKGEQVPKFLTEALKAALKNDELLTADLVKALGALKP